MDPFAPAKLGPLNLRNRIIKAATFEGVTPKRVVTDRLIEFHRRVAAGGVGMTTVAYCAVSREGTTDGRQIVLLDEAVEGLRKLTDAIHTEGAAACAQMGHAGPVANPLGTRVPALAPSRILAPIAMKRTKAATPEDLDRVTEDFVRGAKVAVAGGFDALEIHLGHNYLLSAFMSPKLNKRKDEYGGSVENRARFPRRIVKAVREAAGLDVAVTAKFNMDDGVRGGLLPEDALEIARYLQQDGCLDALELTGGSSLRNPMYLFRGDPPLKEMAETMPGFMKLGFKVFGRRFFPTYPFEEAYFLPTAKRFRDSLQMPLILLGGINKRSTIEGAIAAGFNFVAMGRALLREPDLVRRMQLDPTTEATCIHCNKCMPTIYTGTHCVLEVDQQV
jgi:2,4-dienoyl-CoA reductase-like NADH-dependent reductase (Old Yellow Enzyme family)